MTNTKVCVFAGSIGAREYSILERHASQGCEIALMDKNKELGTMIKAELERIYQVDVFFFHGDVESEEDRDIFMAAVEEMYGGDRLYICHND